VEFVAKAFPWSLWPFSVAFPIAFGYGFAAHPDRTDRVGRKAAPTRGLQILAAKVERREWREFNASCLWNSCRSWLSF